MNEKIRVESVVRSDNVVVMLEAVRQGVGIVQLGSRVIEGYLVSGDIVTILYSYRPASNHLVATAPDTKYMSQKANAFVDFLVESLKIDV